MIEEISEEIEKNIEVNLKRESSHHREWRKGDCYMLNNQILICWLLFTYFIFKVLFAFNGAMISFIYHDFVVIVAAPLANFCV